MKTFFLKKSEQQIPTVTRLTRINLIDVKNQFHSTRIHYVLDFLRFYPCEKILKSQQTHHVRYTIIDSSDFIVVSILNSAWNFDVNRLRLSHESLESKVSNRKSQIESLNRSDQTRTELTIIRVKLTRSTRSPWELRKIVFLPIYV